MPWLASLIMRHRLSHWIDNLPLMTVQRAMHLLYPTTRPWAFFLCDDNDNDRKIFQYFMWSLPPSEEAMTQEKLAQIGRKSVVIAFQPPWILSERDIYEFSQCRSVCNRTHLSHENSHLFTSSLLSACQVMRIRPTWRAKSDCGERSASYRRRARSFSTHH